MKNTFRFLTLTALLATATLTGCNDKLDIEPVDRIDSAKALNTSADVEAALVGAYSALSSNRLYAGYIQFTSELLGDAGEISFVGTFTQPREYIQKTVITNNTFAAGTWLDAYQTINIANNVLANIDKVSTARRDRVEGEARFIRAALYFELVRLYAKDWSNGSPQANPGVPLVLSPTLTLGATNQVARNTVAEVYTQVLSDLTTAEAKLPVTNGFFATRGAAAGMLSRVYLQQRRYAEAAQAANRVITSNRYSLTGTYAEEFTTTTNTSEDIFAIQITSQDGINDLNTYFSPAQRGDIEVQEDHLNLYEADDERGAFFDDVYTLKFDNQYGNVKVMRLAELYLTRAEANLRAGTTLGATPLADVNRIRARAGLSALTSVTLVDILKERRLELAFEGFRLWDAKRNNETVGTLAATDDRLVLPIPQRERDVNPTLVQNPGYN
ncbi:RagB/SusD family nutrient uptake outer membrane protein [Hymenobacter swuensis]|uniref:RagB/SusD domain-containing protein n=1 Tax=Hymenobacter swuensis DY53 TaxID=1227739 RepID=W8FAJ8_9BACT|nr:RagB/SusD family nutrient uptake outer membrane protein [Hymenobacter swuensis]AHJ98730.1 hypothetical protein Hsw_3135 [Hymenobacter swuensis DY53]